MCKMVFTVVDKPIFGSKLSEYFSTIVGTMLSWYLKSISAKSNGKEDCGNEQLGESNRFGGNILQTRPFYPIDSWQIQVVRACKIISVSVIEISGWKIIQEFMKKQNRMSGCISSYAAPGSGLWTADNFSGYLQNYADIWGSVNLQRNRGSINWEGDAFPGSIYFLVKYSKYRIRLPSESHSLSSVTIWFLA